MADLDPTVQKLLEALESVSDSIRSGQDAFADSKDKSEEVTRKLDSELRKLGLTLKTVTNQEDDLVKKRTDRAKLEEEVNQKLKQSGKVREDATQAEVEHYKNTQKQNVLFENTLASMGRYIDANNKIVKSTVDLSQAQQKTIDKFKSQDQATEKFNDMMGGMGKTLGIFAAKAAFELLSAAVIGTYKGMVAAQDALFDGQRGQSVEAAEAAEKMRAMAGATERIGSMMTDLGTTIAGVGLLFAAVNPVIGLLTAAVGGLIAVLGYGTQASAEIQKREAELELKRAKLNDELYANFQKLSGASLTGAEGMTGVYNDLHKFGLTIKDFDKFGKVLQENTKNLALFGAGTVDGVKKFTETASTLVKSELGKTLETMGITVEEQMSHTAAYMTQQARFGLKSSQDQAAAAGKYIQELDKLAVLTGATRKEQEDARKAVMNVNQLRSAMIEAAESGQTEKAQELQRAFETASSMMAAGMKDEAGAFARLMSAGGVVDADTARAQQMYGGKGGLVEATRTGQGSEFERLEMAARGAYQQEARFSGTTKMTGTISGVTSENVSAIADLMVTLKKYGESEEAKKGMKFEEYVEKTRTVTDKATKDQRELELKNREKALNQEIALMNRQDIAATTMMAAGNKLTEAADKMLEASMNMLKSSWEKTKEWLNSISSNPESGPQQPGTGPGRFGPGGGSPRGPGYNGFSFGGGTSGNGAGAGYLLGDDKQSGTPAVTPTAPAASSPSRGPSAGKGPGPSRSSPAPVSPSSDSGTHAPSSDRAGGSPPKLSNISSKSGKSAQVGSEYAFAFQQLIDYLDKTGYDIRSLGGYVDRDVRDKPGVKSVHAKGAAIDINPATNPMGSELVTDMPSEIASVAHSLGLGWGGNWKSKKDAMHFSAASSEGGNLLQAKKGGITKGSMNGYLVEAHGDEIISPLSPNSILEQLGKTPVPTAAVSSAQYDNSEMNGKMLKQLFSMMENKFDEMIRKLDTGNDYSDKLVKAMA